jgi:hypothetical protein
MKRRASLAFLALITGLAGLVMALSPFSEGASRRGVVKLVERYSRDVSVGPTSVGEINVYCPRGYRPTGGQEILGALDLVFSASSNNRRGWHVAAGNPTGDTHRFTAGVICAKGTGTVSVRNAMGAGDKRGAIRDYKSRLH